MNIFANMISILILGTGNVASHLNKAFLKTENVDVINMTYVDKSRHKQNSKIFIKL